MASPQAPAPLLELPVLGSRRLSNVLVALVVTTGGIGFLLTSVSSYLGTDLLPIGHPAELAWLPQGLVMGLYGLAAMALCAVLGLFIQRTDTGKAIRAVAKERVGARLVGIDVDRIFAISFGIGLATLGAAACLLMPIFYVSPTTGHVFVMVAFTVVVLGGMGSFLGAVIGGLIVGLTESFGGLFLGESLGQIGISLIFILILLFRPSGLFGAKR